MLSMSKVFGDNLEYEMPDMSTPAFDEIIADKLLLEDLYRRLDEVIPDGSRVFQMRAHDYSEREIAKALGIKAQSTLSYRIRKMDDFIRNHREELEDLFR